MLFISRLKGRPALLLKEGKSSAWAKENMRLETIATLRRMAATLASRPVVFLGQKLSLRIDSGCLTGKLAGREA
jgi:hypothetical protein